MLYLHEISLIEGMNIVVRQSYLSRIERYISLPTTPGNSFLPIAYPNT